ncbi:MAG: nucleotidyltransferase domain-containing protein [Gemmatimonadota bacterium]
MNRAAAADGIRDEDLRGAWGVGADSRKAGSVWPTPEQEILLRAGLLDAPASIEAWRSYVGSLEPGEMHGGTHEILPLVYSNLRHIAQADDRLESIKPYYFRAWGRNQTAFRILRDVVPLLEDAGIETLIIKGAAVVPLYYEDNGARGMGDIDVLVRVESFGDAVERLREAGWRTFYWHPDHFDVRFEHAIAFLNERGESVDLHCHLLMACCEPGADDRFWQSSRSVEIEGVRTRTLSAEHHLIHTCVHGMNWVQEPLVRWVTDATRIIRSTDVIDWESLVSTAAERGVAPAVGPPLDYLRRTFDLPVPVEVIRDLERASTRADARRLETWTRNTRGRPIRLLRHHWSMYRRGVRDLTWTEKLAVAPDYLRFWFHVHRLRDIPPRLGLKTARVIGRALGFYRYWDE